jgi:hypothetical protein
VYVYGIAPRSRIQATAADVSRPPEKAMPTRSPTGNDIRTFAFEAVEEAASDMADDATRRRLIPLGDTCR